VCNTVCRVPTTAVGVLSCGPAAAHVCRPGCAVQHCDTHAGCWQGDAAGLQYLGGRHSPVAPTPGGKPYSSTATLRSWGGLRRRSIHLRSLAAIRCTLRGSTRAAGGQ
jgi:hypothetical protein